MSPARAQERRDISPVLIPMGVIAGTIALWFGLPGLLLTWLALAVAGFMHPAPRPKASEKDEDWVADARKKHQFFTTMAYTLIAPSKGWGFGIPPLYSFFGALFVAAFALHLPQFHHQTVTAAITEWTPGLAEISVWFAPLNAVAAMLICLALAWARRKTMDSEEVCPGTRISDAITVGRSKPYLVIGPGVLGAVAAVIIAPALAQQSDWPAGAVTLLAVIGGLLAGTYPAARHEALTHWREVLEHRREWRERFKAIKKDPPPKVDDLQHLGREESRITVLHLTSNAAVGGSEWFLKNPDKLAATVGGSKTIAVAPVEQTDSKGQPKPGTVDAVKFDIIELPSSEAVPSLGSSETDEKVTEQLLRAVFAQASAANAARFMPTGHEVITTSEARVLKVSVSGTDVKTASQMLPEFSAAIGADCVADPSADNKAGALYMGQFDGAEFTEESGVTTDTIQYLLKEDWWNQRWGDAIKKGENPPKPEWKTEATETLADGTEIENLVFVIRRGMTPEKDFFPFEQELATALESFPFVSMTGFKDPRASRPGERHRQAVSVRRAKRAVPDSIEAIAPVRGSKGPEWVLAAVVNRGFADAKLARPELAAAEPISTNRSRKHLWQMHVRLYGGVTLADVRKKQHQLMESWGAAYLRVAETRDGVKIIAGAEPGEVDIRDDRARTRLAALEWEQIFIDSGVKSESGKMPQLISSVPVPENPKVSTLTFSLQGTGLSLEQFTSRVPKLKANSGNAYVQPQDASSGKPNEIEIVICETDPMPFPAPADYELADEREDLPFAVDVYGRTISYDPRSSPHLLLAGTTGSGKSVAVQLMLYSALLRGWEVYIADPSKGGTDFFFSEDYIAGMTGDVYEAAGMMRHVYEEVTRRKALNTEHKVSKVSELPAEVRPPRILMILDEFTSLMMQEKPPERSDNPEAAAAREEVVSLNAEKQTIGYLAGKIAREARSAEVTLILATQKLDAKTLDNIGGAQDLKANLGRGLLGNSTLGDKQSALRSPYDAPELGDAIPPGRGLWEPLTAPKAEAIQSWFDPGEQDSYRAELAKRLEAWPEEDRPDWKKHTRNVDDAPTVQPLEDDDSVVIEQDLGEMEVDFDFDDDEDEVEGVEPASEEVAADQAEHQEDAGADPHHGAELETVELEPEDGSAPDVGVVVDAADEWLNEHHADAPVFDIEITEHSDNAAVELVFEPDSHDSDADAEELAAAMAEMLGSRSFEGADFAVATVIVPLGEQTDDEIVAQFDRSTIDDDHDGIEVRTPTGR